MGRCQMGGPLRGPRSTPLPRTGSPVRTRGWSMSWMLPLKPVFTDRTCRSRRGAVGADVWREAACLGRPNSSGLRTHDRRTTGEPGGNHDQVCCSSCVARSTHAKVYRRGGQDGQGRQRIRRSSPIVNNATTVRTVECSGILWFASVGHVSNPDDETAGPSGRGVGDDSRESLRLFSRGPAGHSRR